MVRSHETSFIGCGSCSGQLIKMIESLSFMCYRRCEDRYQTCSWDLPILNPFTAGANWNHCVFVCQLLILASRLNLWQLWQHSPPFANTWHSYFHISGLPHFLLIKHMLSGCPTIGRGKLRGQSSSEHNKGSGGLWLQRQLNIPPPALSRFVYCTLSFGFLPFMKGR